MSQYIHSSRSISVYLHPDDYARLANIQDLIREDARRALAACLAQWNAKLPFRRDKQHKLYRIARNDWWIEFFAGSDNVLMLCVGTTHSRLSPRGERGRKSALAVHGDGAMATREVDLEMHPARNERWHARAMGAVLK
jgi:hypothetical protein